MLSRLPLKPILALVALLVVVGGVVFAVTRLTGGTANPTAAVSMAAGEVRVLLTRFETPSGGGAFPRADEWKTGLENVIATTPFNGMTVRVDVIDTVVNSRADAIALSDQHGAALVVWGDARLGGVDAAYTVTPRGCPLCALTAVTPAECMSDDLTRAAVNVGEERALYGFVLALAAYYGGDLDAAFALINHAVRSVAPDRAAALNLPSMLVYRGAILSERGALNEALANYDRAIALDPRQLCANVGRAALFSGLQLWDEALADYDALINAATPSDWAYRARAVGWRGQSQYDPALRDLDAAAALDPTDAANFYWRGMVYLTLSDPTNALAQFDQAVRLQPTSADYRAWRAAAYRQLGRADEALTDLIEAVRLAPRRASHYSAVGDFYFDQNRPQDALDYKSRAIALDLDNARYYTDLGGIYYFALRDFPAAVEVYTQALYVDRLNVTAYYYRALSRYELRQLDDALLDFDEAIRIEADNAGYRAWRARTYAELGRTDEALTDLNEAIRLEPENASHHSAVGDVYYAQGRYQEAIDSESRAIALEPGNVRHYTDLGGIYLFALDDPANAIEVYSRALGVDAADSVALFYRGRAYFAAGRIEEARADMQAALQVDPNNADYRAWLAENGQTLGWSG